MKHTECLRPIDRETAALAAQAFDKLRQTGQPFGLSVRSYFQPDGQVAFSILVDVDPDTVIEESYVIPYGQMQSDF